MAKVMPQEAQVQDSAMVVPPTPNRPSQRRLHSAWGKMDMAKVMPQQAQVQGSTKHSLKYHVPIRSFAFSLGIRCHYGMLFSLFTFLVGWRCMCPSSPVLVRGHGGTEAGRKCLRSRRFPAQSHSCPCLVHRHIHTPTIGVGQ